MKDIKNRFSGQFRDYLEHYTNLLAEVPLVHASKNQIGFVDTSNSCKHSRRVNTLLKLVYMKII